MVSQTQNQNVTQVMKWRLPSRTIDSKLNDAMPCAMMMFVLSLENTLSPIKVGTRWVSGQRLLHRGRCGIHVVVGHIAKLLALRHMSPRANRWKQINDKWQDIAGEDKGNHPFEDGRCIFLSGIGTLPGADAKGNDKGKFDNDERQLDDEAD